MNSKTWLIHISWNWSFSKWPRKMRAVCIANTTCCCGAEGCGIGAAGDYSISCTGVSNTSVFLICDGSSLFCWYFQIAMSVQFANMALIAIALTVWMSLYCALLRAPKSPSGTFLQVRLIMSWAVLSHLICKFHMLLTAGQADSVWKTFSSCTSAYRA